ncbi:MAG TPA: hypothetical protein VIP06_00545, partial [Nocardioides sp.]
MRSGENVRTLGVVGTGAIGVSWVVLGLEHGLDVVAWDPAEGAEERLRAQVPEGSLRFAGGLGEI